MNNPLQKRVFKDLISEKGRYIAIFLFMLISIGFISGFLVASDSMLKAYNESFEKYNVENGNFELADIADDGVKEVAKKNSITLYENYYKEENADDKSIIRIFINREEVNKACLMKGELPKQDNEIAIDRMYADNNNYKVGDTITLANKEVKISGLVALSDYSALFSDNNDTMFDAVKFGVGIMTKTGFENISNTKLHYSYSWKYSEEAKDKKQEKEWADKFSSDLNQVTTILNYIPRYKNQAIQFTADDFQSDQGMMSMLLYIVITIIAFIFAVTISNTVSKEATVIGTLRASGYSKAELIKHYMAGPLLVTLTASVLGNIMGYTVFKNLAATAYYGSYSLPTFTTVWNSEAFLKTTAVPFVIMLVINFIVLSNKLKLEPLRFLKRDLTKKKRKKAIKLPHYKFFTRFKIRVILQNMSGYMTMFVGIIFANLLLLFGMMMHPLLDKFNEDVLASQVSKYQYVLMAPMKTEIEDAEKYLAYTLKTDDKYEEEIIIYGIGEDSKYIEQKFPEEGVYISNGYHEKYQVDIGDTITLKEEYMDKKYTFKVKGYYDYPATLSIFMNSKVFSDTFGIPKDYFNGYFSNAELTDINENYIISTITEEDLTKVSRQLNVSMGTIFYMFNVFAVVLFMLMIFLLSKLVIEKNTNSISMVKILGYNNSEIRKLYISSTTIMVAISLILSLPIDAIIMKYLYRFFMMDMTGWLTLYINPNVYWQMFLIGMISYLVIELFLVRKIKKVHMDEALKNVE